MRADRPVKAGCRHVDDRRVQQRVGDPAFARALAAALAGQSPGFDWLWHRFARQVVAFARAQGSDDAEGLCNEIFVAAFGQLERFTGDEDGFVALLFSIARNKVIDDRRKQGRRLLTRSFTAGDERCGGDVEAEALEQIDGDVAKLLATLTDEQQEVLHLRLIADLSLEQTAAVTGRSVNAVKALQHRATNALRKKISEEAVTR